MLVGVLIDIIQLSSITKRVKTLYEIKRFNNYKEESSKTEFENRQLLCIDLLRLACLL